jgi:uncharacterized protein (DUF697 family)
MNKKRLPRAIRPTAAEKSEAGRAPTAGQRTETASARPAMAKEAAGSGEPGKGPSIMAQEVTSPDATSPDTSRVIAEKLVERFALWSGAAGLIPLPLVDLATVGGVQIQMLRRLSRIYDVPFSANRGKALIAALAGSLIPASSGLGAVSLIKSVPVAGMVVSALAMPVLSAGATYAIGMAFIEHFASGGTLLDFHPPDYREFIKAQKAKYRARSTAGRA